MSSPTTNTRTKAQQALRAADPEREPRGSASRAVAEPGKLRRESSGGRVQQLLGRLWTAPDPELVDAGQRGEWLIAGMRVLTVLLILAVLLDRYLGTPEADGREIMLWVGVAALAEALVIYAAVRRSWGRGWIGFFSGILDVSLVSLGLFNFLRIGQPFEALQDLVIFPIYFLAICATSLRYDWRISILTGLAAIAQYGALVYYAVWQWDLDHPPTAAELGGEFAWMPQLGRLALMAMATLLATTLIIRAQEQRTLSNRDRLTNLANRGFFDESLARIGALASRSGEPVTVAMIDVDHFKKFNDTHGHLAGDRALVEVAGILASSFRTTDLVARYGGEEFVGLFPGMSLEDATWRLEELRRQIAGTEVPTDSGRRVRVTISVGVAVWPRDGDSLPDTLALADLRLYEAKEAGRNRVVSG